MIFTNRYNLPDALAAALQPSEREIIRGRYSVSALSDAPLQRMLRMQYSKQITVDASEQLNTLLGSAVHDYLHDSEIALSKVKGALMGTIESKIRLMVPGHTAENIIELLKSDLAPSEDMSETRMEVPIEVDGKTYTISGISDHLQDGHLIDWKVTSVWSYLFGIDSPLGVKEEWLYQLNIYKWMHEQSGRPVKAITNHCILRDWVPSKKFDKKYPQIPFVSIKTPMLTTDQIVAYIESRVRLHSMAEFIALDEKAPMEVPPCTPAERWERAPVWKIISPASKKSLRNLPSQLEAQQWLSDAIKKKPGDKKFHGAQVVRFTGGSPRCTDYCSVFSICPYFKQFTKQEESL